MPEEGLTLFWTLTETHLIVGKSNTSGWIKPLIITKNVQADQNSNLQSFPSKNPTSGRKYMYSFLDHSLFTMLRQIDIA